ncbi:MAG: serpin family protein [Candidatus Binatia bacterium]
MRQRSLMPVISALLVLTLLNSTRSKADEPQTATADPTLAKAAVQASNHFATDLYHQLAKTNVGSNLFFSPYSISSALIMTAEGARGETAQQMGTVLRLPESARNTGENATSLPWKLSPIHAGMASLRHSLTGGAADPAKTAEIEKKIAQLEQEHQELTAKVQQLQAEDQWEAASETSIRATAVTRELNDLRQQVNQYELRIANALWGEQTFPFRPVFLETLNNAYGAGAIPVDFLHHWEDARARINRWVEEETRNRIQNLLAEGTVTRDTRLVLANAIYFKGRWADEFDKSKTQEADFTLGDGKTTKAELMTTRNLKAQYAELSPDGTRNDPVFAKGDYQLDPNPDGFQMLELPYRGNALAMVVLLPKRHDGLPALEQRLTAETLTTWLETMRKQKVHVFLPKFTLETSYDLPETLSALGMPAAFAPGGFTGVSDAPEADTLALSEVIHKAFVDVNEEGTEAAAATAVTIRALSAMIEPPPPTFRADRSFLFLIRDIHSGAILFLGRIMNPLHPAL